MVMSAAFEAVVAATRFGYAARGALNAKVFPDTAGIKPFDGPLRA